MLGKAGMCWPMSNIIKANPSFEEILFIAQRLRQRDKEEIWPIVPYDDAETLAVVHFNDGSRPELNWVAYDNDGKPSIFFGAHENFKGNWTAYLFATDNFKDCVWEVTNFVHHQMLPLIEEFGGHYLDATSLASDKISNNWLHGFGAKVEAVLRAYGKNKQDYNLFVWRPKCALVS